MNKTKMVIRILCGVLLLAGCDGARAAGIVPEGCIEMPGATAGDMGYATQVKQVKTGIELILVPSGSFKLKSSENVPITDVTFARPFYIGKYTITNKQYKQFLAANPGYDGAKDCDPAYDLHVRHLRGKSIMPAGDDYPVIWVSWKNAKAFCSWAGDLDLPSEAQWEYACRAGTTTRFSFGDEPGNGKEIANRYAWTHFNSKRTTQPVGQLLPNNWGLYDMHGNVWEWCLDDEKPCFFRHPPMPTDGSAYFEKDEAAIIVKGLTTKILRGSSWSNTIYPVSVTYNIVPVVAANDVGFRVVLQLNRKEGAAMSDDKPNETGGETENAPLTAVKGLILLAPKGPADLKPDAKILNKVLQMDGGNVARELPAEHQLITFGWDDLHIFRPDLVYVPEKDQLLLHFLMRPERYSALIYSDDHGKTWSSPQYLKDDQGNVLRDSIGLAYLGNGKLMITTGESDDFESGLTRVFSSDYGATWSRPEPTPPDHDGLVWRNWCPFWADMDPKTGKLVRVGDPGYSGPITHQIKMERAFDVIEKLVNLPTKWHWRSDPDNRGLAEGWSKEASFDKWDRMMRIDRPWTQQGEPLGVAWYAVNFEMPKTGGKPLTLLFYAVDGFCDVFVDGEKVGEQKRPLDEMWDMPFHISLDKGLAPGKHRLVVRVEKDCWAAGIWKPVAIAEKSRVVIPPREEGKIFPSVWIRYSYDGGHTWPETVEPTTWKDAASGVGISEVGLCRAGNGDIVAACRIKYAKYQRDHTTDHYAGLGVSLSRDNGYTWTKINVLYDYGRMQPSMVLMPNNDLVLIYVVRMGALKEEDRLLDDDGYPQWSIEAIVSRDHGVTWDLEHKYVLGRWSGDNQAQSTSTVLLPDSSLVTAFGSGYRARPEKGNPSGPVHEVCLVRWRP